MPQDFIIQALNDSDILDWIERELQTQLSCGRFWHVMHEVHKGVPLREAAAEQLHQADADPRLAVDPVIDEE